MLEQVTSEIRARKAPQGFLGTLGQVFFIDFYNAQNHKIETIGTIYPDNTFAPPTLKKRIKNIEKEHNAVTLPVTVEILSNAKTPDSSASR